jgi:hypothetical protein
MMFGRKGLGGQPPAQPPAQAAAAPQDGRQWAILHFQRNEQPGSLGYGQQIGLKLFDDAYNAMKDERGVRIESIVAMLASVGGYLALTAVLDALKAEGKAPQDIGMVVLRGNDGNIFYFGDAPNWLLCEAPHSLVSLLFGAAHANGAPVTIELLHEEMRNVAQRAGTPEFLDLPLPEEHRVDSPLNWAHHFTNFVTSSIKGGGTPDFWAPTVVGFALQQAIDVGRQSLDPMMIAKIALCCAVRAAKLDPARVAAG